MAEKVMVWSSGYIEKWRDSRMLPQNINRLHRYHCEGLFYVDNGTKIEIKPDHIYLFPQNLGFTPSFVPDMTVSHEWIDFVSVPLIFGEHVIEISPEQKTPAANALRLCMALGTKCHENNKNAQYYHLLESAIALAMRCVCLEYSVTLAGNVRINKALEYIHSDYMHEITLEMLAEKAYCAKNYFVRLFKNELGITPYQYIKNYRMGVATDLLYRGYTVKEVAKRVGFSDAYAFSAAFNKCFGIYPSAYPKSV